MTAEPVEDPLEEAMASLTLERRRLDDEYHAFKRFRQRLRELDACEPNTGGRTPLVRERTVGLAQIREAYSETVMTVPHFHSEYNETFEQHLAGEYGAELAAAVTQGGQLHPPLKRSLLGATTQAMTARKSLLSVIERETNVLESFEREFTRLNEEFSAVVGQPLERIEFNALSRSRERLQAVKRSCEGLLVERQQCLREHQQSAAGIDVECVCLYFYEDCERTYPVLDGIAALVERTERSIETIESHLANTV